MKPTWKNFMTLIGDCDGPYLEGEHLILIAKLLAIPREGTFSGIAVYHTVIKIGMGDGDIEEIVSWEKEKLAIFAGKNWRERHGGGDVLGKEEIPLLSLRLGAYE